MLPPKEGFQPFLEGESRACSTSRRMASEREEMALREAQASILAVNAGAIRTPTSGSTPVAGRPLFFRLTGIDNFIFPLY